jgi:hypothetical protein
LLEWSKLCIHYADPLGRGCDRIGHCGYAHALWSLTKPDWSSVETDYPSKDKVMTYTFHRYYMLARKDNKHGFAGGIPDEIEDIVRHNNPNMDEEFERWYAKWVSEMPRGSAANEERKLAPPPQDFWQTAPRPPPPQRPVAPQPPAPPAPPGAAAAAAADSWAGSSNAGFRAAAKNWAISAPSSSSGAAAAASSAATRSATSGSKIPRSEGQTYFGEPLAPDESKGHGPRRSAGGASSSQGAAGKGGTAEPILGSAASADSDVFGWGQAGPAMRKPFFCHRSGCDVVVEVLHHTGIATEVVCRARKCSASTTSCAWP